jgi:hypothetical protein
LRSMIKNLLILSSVTFLFISFACASDVDKHKQEAKNLCEVYNPEYWVDFFKNNKPSISETRCLQFYKGSS